MERYSLQLEFVGPPFFFASAGAVSLSLYRFPSISFHDVTIGILVKGVRHTQARGLLEV